MPGRDRSRNLHHHPANRAAHPAGPTPAGGRLERVRSGAPPVGRARPGHLGRDLRPADRLARGRWRSAVRSRGGRRIAGSLGGAGAVSWRRAARAGSGGLGGARPDALFLAGDIGPAHLPPAVQLGQAWPRHPRTQPLAARELPHLAPDQGHGRPSAAGVDHRYGRDRRKGAAAPCRCSTGRRRRSRSWRTNRAERATVSDWLGRCLGDAIAPSQIAAAGAQRGSVIACARRHQGRRTRSARRCGHRANDHARREGAGVPPRSR